MKYFAEEVPAYHIVAAGSLLGVSINRAESSFPVGKVEVISLYPLDVEEFLWALGQKASCAIIRHSFLKNEVCSLHHTLIDYYKKYLCIGGMPQVVKEYVDISDFNFVVSLQKNINDAFIADMAKYATPMDTVRIMAAFNSIPAQLAKENRKFQYHIIKTGAKANVYETSLEWLRASGIVMMCTKIKEGKFPLTAYSEPSSFKIYMTDTGLLCSKYGINLVTIMSELPGFNYIKGTLAENYVASALLTNGYKPYYWESQGRAEVDFVIQNKQGEIIPAEVKSSENVRSRSLQQFVSKYNPPYSIRISTRNFGFENNIKSIPLYAVFCI